MKYVLALAITITSAANAAAFSGNDLHEFCIQAPQDSPQSAVCSAFIRGVLDGFQHGRLMGQAGIRICEPQNLSPGQARLIIEKYMRDKPADLHVGAVAIALAGIMVAYPCPK